MGEKETSSADLAKLYQGGATLAKTAAETGLGRFAVAYRLEKAGVERRNPGSPRKTAEEKGAFAKQRLKEIFGDSWPAVANDLEAGKVSARKLAIANGVSHSNLLSQLKRAGIEIPKKKQNPASLAAAGQKMAIRQWQGRLQWLPFLI